MSDESILHGAEASHGAEPDAGLTRRAFGLATAASVAVGTVRTGAAATETVERDVEIATPDGSADAVLFHPAGAGRWPAVLIWTDILGLRPVFRDMGHRLAAQGYVVLVPNPFYRAKRAPIVGPDFDLSKPADRDQVMPLMAALTPETTERDAVAFMRFLDAQPQTDGTKKAGVQGYCMGGFLSFRTTAAVPSRIGATASFHGARLVTDKPDSPHRLIPRFQSRVYCGVAHNDDAKEPAAKDALREAFAAAHVPATVDVYADGDHGWCVKGSHAYNEAAAERAWGHLTALYKDALA